jgi:hypothetical protein
MPLRGRVGQPCVWTGKGCSGLRNLGGRQPPTHAPGNERMNGDSAWKRREAR